MIAILSPELTLYNAYYKIAQGLGVGVYDYLPGDTVTYPFIHLGMTQNVPSVTKTSLNGQIFQTIDVWGQQQQRKAVAELTDRIFYAHRSEFLSGVYRFRPLLDEADKELTIDTSVSYQVFMRGHLELRFEIM